MRKLITIATSAIFVATLLLAPVATTQTGNPSGGQRNRESQGNGTKKQSLSLNGRWKDDGNGELVDITMSGASVTAKYVAPRRCKYPGADRSFSNPTWPTLATDFTGMLDAATNTIKGQIFICFFDTKKLLTFSTGPTSLRLDKVSEKSISGEYDTPDRGTQTVTYTFISRLKSYLNGTGHEIPRKRPFEGHPDDMVPEEDCPNDMWILTNIELAAKENNPASQFGEVPKCICTYTATWICPSNKIIRTTKDTETFNALIPPDMDLGGTPNAFGTYYCPHIP